MKRFGGLIKLPPGYKEGYLHFEQLEVPVITEGCKVLTHIADFLLAKELGLEEIEVLVCDIEELELPLFIGFKHLLLQKDYPAIYEAILRYTGYLNSEEGKRADWLTGDMDHKLHQLIGYSEAHIKRIRKVGNKMPSELGLIQQGEKTWKQVEDEIRQEEKEKAMAEMNTELANVDLEEDGAAGESNGNIPSPPQRNAGFTSTPTQRGGYDTFASTISYGTGDKVEINVTKKETEVWVNGRLLKKAKHTFRADGSEGRTEAYSHVFHYLPKTVNASFQIILENPRKFFKEVRDEENVD